MVLPPYTTLNGGKYVITQVIGQGGFGITYKAVQRGLDRTVCIKEYFLDGRCARDIQSRAIRPWNISAEVFEKYRLSFVKEAKTLATLHHPGIVEVIDIFDENNTSYMVMPFIEGQSLQTIVDDNGPLQYPEAVNYIAQVANAVGYIHERHILHRDIKPANIMITADYKAVLIDFGSAREYVEDMTQSHTSILTHGYAPPEQYSRTSRKGSYTDIYAIGATLYFILTGRVPVDAAARLTEPMPDPRELNPKLPEEANRTIMKAMQLKPQDRHQNIIEFMTDLRNVKRMNHDGVSDNSSAHYPHRNKKEKTNWRFVVWLAWRFVVWLAVGAIIIALVYFAINNHKQDKTEAPPAPKTPSNVYDYIPEGWSITKLDKGYLDNDGLLDTVLIVSPNDNNDSRQPFLARCTGAPDAQQKRWRQYDGIFPSSDGKCSFKYELEVKQNNNFVIRILNCKGIRYSYNYQYKNGDYELIGREVVDLDGMHTLLSHDYVRHNLIDPVTGEKVNSPQIKPSHKKLGETPLNINPGTVNLGLPSGTLWYEINEEKTGDKNDLYQYVYAYDDAVTLYGNNLPSEKQWEELRDRCRWAWAGSGYIVSSNGNFIYLPAAGVSYYAEPTEYQGEIGVYWALEDASFFQFYKDDFENQLGRYVYCSVRLVEKSK